MVQQNIKMQKLSLLCKLKGRVIVLFLELQIEVDFENQKLTEGTKWD